MKETVELMREALPPVICVACVVTSGYYPEAAWLLILAAYFAGLFAMDIRGRRVGKMRN